MKRGTDLSDAGQADEERGEAHGGHEELLAFAQQTRPLVHHGRDEALQRAELPSHRFATCSIHTTLMSTISSNPTVAPCIALPTQPNLT